MHLPATPPPGRLTMTMTTTRSLRPLYNIGLWRDCMGRQGTEAKVRLDKLYFARIYAICRGERALFPGQVLSMEAQNRTFAGDCQRDCRLVPALSQYQSHYS